MSSLLTPGGRPGAWDTLGDHARRIARLEAIPAVDFSGAIRFDFDNEGGYLDVTTNALDGDGFGMHFKDLTDGGMLFETRGTHGGMTFNEVSVDGGQFFEEFGDGGQWFFNTGAGQTFIRQSGTADLALVKSGTGDLTATSAGKILTSSDDATQFSTTGSAPIQALAGGAFNVVAGTSIGLIANGGSILLDATSGVTSARIDIRVLAGNYLLVSDQALTEYFRVTPGGAGTVKMLNLPTSTAGLASGDLWRNGTVVNIV